ncbi:MAG TPA: hypothetical protein VGM92_12245 [Candidatus Kapabacteria bacterium]
MIALVLLAVAIVVLAMFHLFRPYDKWVIGAMLCVYAVLGFIISVARLSRHRHRTHKAKTTRDSLLKHLWEEAHKREW